MHFSSAPYKLNCELCALCSELFINYNTLHQKPKYMNIWVFEYLKFEDICFIFSRKLSLCLLQLYSIYFCLEQKQKQKKNKHELFDHVTSVKNLKILKDSWKRNKCLPNTDIVLEKVRKWVWMSCKLWLKVHTSTWSIQYSERYI